MNLQRTLNNVSLMFDTDVFVLGGGPAGLAAALAARQRGFSVVLADAARPPIDKACGEGLMPNCLTAATQLGVCLPASLGHPFRGIRFVGSRNQVEASFPNGMGRGVRRTELHQHLADATAKAGVQLLWGTAVTGIEDHSISTAEGTLTARWIIGADGGQSRARRWTGLGDIRREAHRFGFRRHYKIAPWCDFVEIHWGANCQFYITPTAADEISLVLISRDSRLRIDEALPLFPALRDRLTGVPFGQERGSFAATRRLKRVASDHVALIGDASGTIDAITGEGLCMAFQQALALAEAMEAGDLGIYRKAHARLARPPLVMAEFMLLMDRSRLLQSRVLQALSSRPELFARLLATHVGKFEVPQFAAAAASLGWQVLTA